MLAMNTYPRAYIEACRTASVARMKRYRAVAETADANVLAAFETDFCNGQVLALECFFMHRTRAIEGKDGNPANEVRLLAAALMAGSGRMAVDKTIKYDPAKSVLGLKVGDTIALTAGDFDRLADAYFTEISKRFAE